MSLLCAVLVGHLLGDWVVQTDWQARNKMGDWFAMEQHMLGYHLVMLVALLWARPSFWTGFAILAVSTVTHNFIDRRWPVIWLLEHTGSKEFARTPWGVIATDQALHLSILIGMAGVLS